MSERNNNSNDNNTKKFQAEVKSYEIKAVNEVPGAENVRKEDQRCRCKYVCCKYWPPYQMSRFKGDILLLIITQISLSSNHDTLFRCLYFGISNHIKYPLWYFTVKILSI